MGFADMYLTSKIKIDDIIEEPCVISTRLQ